MGDVDWASGAYANRVYTPGYMGLNTQRVYCELPPEYITKNQTTLKLLRKRKFRKIENI